MFRNCLEQGLRVRGGGVDSSVNEHAEDERNAVIGNFGTTLLLLLKLTRVSTVQYDSIIIGSGIAGLNLARKLSQAGHKVFIAAKEAVTEGSSKYAQGGVAVCSPLNPEDNCESHIEDTLRASKGLANPETVKAIVTNAWPRLEELIKFGVNFDKDFNIEGSHSYSRVMHVADATGRAILKPLLDRVSRNHNVSIAQGTECISLLKSGSKVVGARFRNIAREEFDVFASNVVLASGGLGGLYEESTNPSILTGDGIALAYDAGAEIENLEFVQFHPTVFFAGRSQARFKQRNFLITEAVRGAGALLRNINGELFAQNYHPDAELATRDIVSRAIIAEMKVTGADCVFLDMRAIPRETLLTKFPNVYQTCRDYGYKLEQDLLPVRPAAHYTIGGIKTDINGRSNLEGLWALGECASNGLHGANRLASNSLLECIVVSDFVATDILSLQENCVSSLRGAKGDEVTHLANGLLHFTGNDVKATSNYPECVDLDEIRSILDKYVGLERSAEGLKYAQELISKLPDSAQKTTAMLLIVSATQRQESRGTHYRSDFPDANIEFEHSTIISKPSLTHHV